MISTYRVPLEQVDEARADHLAFLGGLEADGLLVSAGRQDPPAGGVVLLAVDSEARAREVMAADPYVTGDLATYQAIGWTPARGALVNWTAG
ncbi:YciI family protein [Mangrovihabitans endophyticus]|nr:YciI family protein [Mangrovihabitans endophyticus]